MKKWFRGLAALGVLSLAGVAVMSAFVMTAADEQPAALDMALGQASDFSPVKLTGRVTDPGYEVGAWWEQTLTFGEDVQTESRFYSSVKAPDNPLSLLDRTGASLWSEDASGLPELMDAFDGTYPPEGEYLISDYLDRYSYSLDFHGEALGAGLGLSFPWLWSAVGEKDHVEVEPGAGAMMISASPLSATIPLVRLEDGWAFTLPNLFHGARARDDETGEQGEVLQYGGSSGIFMIDDTPLVYDPETGLPMIRQLYDIPISSELDTFVLRLDWMPERGVLSLLVSEGGQLSLRLFDPKSNKLTAALALGPSTLGAQGAGDELPDSCFVRVQGDLLLILQGAGTGMPSRALTVQVNEEGKPALLQDTAFDTSLYADDYTLERSDEGMFWKEGVLYVLEADDFWSQRGLLYAVGKEGLIAVGMLQNAGSVQENTAAFYQMTTGKTPPFTLTPGFGFRGWRRLKMGEK